MDDTKYVFENENFIEFSKETNEGLGILYKVLFENIKSLIPLDEIGKKRVNNCIRFKLSASDSLINSNSENVRNLIFEAIEKIDTNTLKYIEVCNSRKNTRPKIEIRFEDISKKGKYSHHYITHTITNYLNYKPKENLESIEEELIKLKTISADIVYKIGVSSDIGILD